MKQKLKKLFKGTPNLPVPRSAEEINREYSDLCAKAGAAQYQISILSAHVVSLQGRIKELDAEAGARGKLDTELANELAKRNAIQPVPTATKEA